jgi:hypothetical protein
VLTPKIIHSFFNTNEVLSTSFKYYIPECKEYVNNLDYKIIGESYVNYISNCMKTSKNTYYKIYDVISINNLILTNRIAYLVKKYNCTISFSNYNEQLRLNIHPILSSTVYYNINCIRKFIFNNFHIYSEKISRNLIEIKNAGILFKICEGTNKHIYYDDDNNCVMINLTGISEIMNFWCNDQLRKVHKKIEFTECLPNVYQIRTCITKSIQSII